MKAVCWIRRDLRLSDHAALAAATERADQVVVAFVFDRNILDALEDRDDRRVTFIHRSLVELDAKLRARGSNLVVLHGNPLEEIPKLAAAFGADLVVAGRDYEPYAIQRDQDVAERLKATGIEFQSVKDTVIFEGGEIFGQSGLPLRVYTPYSKVWRKQFELGDHAAEHTPDLTKLVAYPAATDWSMDALGFAANDLWVSAGEDAGLAQLEAYSHKVDGYAKDRDFPALAATSGLSVHLRFGTVSIRACVRMALERGGHGADKWLAELIWRDFYQDILSHNPRVVREPFNPTYRGLEYPGDESHYQAWEQGLTGYPIVDAAMRCFNATGWMHNRLRMVVASFLTKDLLVDYRRGEAYFARKLLDFDLASNNGGWQWAASVGCDAQPYFRIFNPRLQSLKFDPDGVFIREWIPEIAGLQGEHLHTPTLASAFDLASAGVELGKTYPLPIVDHMVQKERAIQLLGSVGT
ncbi:MAG: cryptochrome/photolyase family protein [Fimbriimonas sp.]